MLQTQKKSMLLQVMPPFSLYSIFDFFFHSLIVANFKCLSRVINLAGRSSSKIRSSHNGPMLQLPSLQKQWLFLQQTYMVQQRVMASIIEPLLRDHVHWNKDVFLKKSICLGIYIHNIQLKLCTWRYGQAQIFDLQRGYY